METPPDALDPTAREILTPERADSRLFKGLLRMNHQADRALVIGAAPSALDMDSAGESVFDERSECD